MSIHLESSLLNTFSMQFAYIEIERYELVFALHEFPQYNVYKDLSRFHMNSIMIPYRFRRRVQKYMNFIFLRYTHFLLPLHFNHLLTPKGFHKTSNP